MGGLSYLCLDFPVHGGGVGLACVFLDGEDLHRQGALAKVDGDLVARLDLV